MFRFVVLPCFDLGPCKPETVLYCTPTFSLLVSHGGHYFMYQLCYVMVECKHIRVHVYKVIQIFIKFL